MPSFDEDFLILCKTYPSPSGRHVETSCVAGMNKAGKLIRLFPVPFRLIDGSQQFRKWQWINARVDKAPRDHRPESHKIFVDTIQFIGDPLPTSGDWKIRRQAISKIPVFESFSDLDNTRINSGATLGLIRPTRIIGLDVTRCSRPDWTEDEKAKLLQSQQQGGLFDNTDAQTLTTLRKVPFDFHYIYECSHGGKSERRKHKIADWEAGALYWNCYRSHGENWERPFRQKIEDRIPQNDLMFLMGTIHRFPDQWMIVSLIYPPKPQPAAPQMALDL